MPELLAPLIEDDAFYPILTSLLGGLERELTRSGIDTPCFLSLVPGDTLPALDMIESGDCGAVAWVRLVSIYPSTSFPAVDEATATCAVPLAAQVEIGMARGMPKLAGRDVRKGPVPAQWLEVTRLIMADQAAMRRVVRGCEKVTEKEIAMGGWTPLPNEGGVGGGFWTMFVSEEDA